MLSIQWKTPELYSLLPDGMYACHRRHAGGEVFFLANDTEDHFSGKAVLQAIGRAERWDPETGEMTELAGRVLSDREMGVSGSTGAGRELGRPQGMGAPHVVHVGVQGLGGDAYPPARWFTRDVGQSGVRS